MFEIKESLDFSSSPNYHQIRNCNYTGEDHCSTVGSCCFFSQYQDREAENRIIQNQYPKIDSINKIPICIFSNSENHSKKVSHFSRVSDKSWYFRRRKMKDNSSIDACYKISTFHSTFLGCSFISDTGNIQPQAFLMSAKPRMIWVRIKRGSWKWTRQQSYLL